MKKGIRIESSDKLNRSSPPRTAPALPQKPLKNFGVRADEDKMVEAHFLKIDTGDLFRSALDREILKRKGQCPTCGQKRKS